MSHISSRAGIVDHGVDYFADQETKAQNSGRDKIVSDGQISGL